MKRSYGLIGLALLLALVIAPLAVSARSPAPNSPGAWLDPAHLTDYIVTDIAIDVYHTIRGIVYQERFCILRTEAYGQCVCQQDFWYIDMNENGMMDKADKVLRTRTTHFSPDPER